MGKLLFNPRSIIGACFAAAILFAGVSLTGSETVQGQMISLDREIAESVLRFHIIANSDSDADQELKLEVRNAVTSIMSRKMSEEGISDKKNAESYVRNNMGEYIDIACRVMEDNGCDYGVQAEIGRCWFPVKTYGKYVFPEGEYDAFRIILGKGEGKNWWCVLFPSLCMVDESYQITGSSPEDSPSAAPGTSDESMKNEVTPENKNFKFRIVEWFCDMW